MTTLADTLKAKREELSQKYYGKPWAELSEDDRNDIEVTAIIEVEGHYYV